jgi:hypothetical protein
MHPVKLTIRGAALALVSVAALGAGCASNSPTGGTTAGAGGATGVAGTTGAAGAASGASGSTGIGTGAAGTGTGSAGTGGEPIGVAGMGTVPSGAGGNVDQGRLFTDAATVTITADDGGATPPPDASTAADTGKTIPGDGNVGTCHIGGMSFVLVFTQKGTDVTMVVTANNCPAGTHTIQIHGGFSCDNAGTEGGVWDGARGAGIPALTCANNQGTLTYTRSGSDPTANWTVGDHSTKTDVTLHPMSVDSRCGTFF